VKSGATLTYQYVTSQNLFTTEALYAQSFGF